MLIAARDTKEFSGNSIAIGNGHRKVSFSIGATANQNFDSKSQVPD